MEQLETHTTITSDDNDGNNELQRTNSGEITYFHDANNFPDDIDSSCSTPYVSAPSSPGRGPSPSFRYFYSAPSSPMHFLLASSPNSPSYVSDASVSGSDEFDFSARLGATGSAPTGAMSSADELFLNGQIRPMKVRLKRLPSLAPLIDEDESEIDFDTAANEGDKAARGRDLKLRDRSIRRTRSMSPLRSKSIDWCRSEESTEAEEQNDPRIEGAEIKENEAGLEEEEMLLPGSASASRSSSAGRSSKRWVFLKDLLYRSKSEGRNNGQKFWSSLSFTPVKDRKLSNTQPASSSDSISTSTTTAEPPKKAKANSARGTTAKKPVAGKVMNGVGKKRVPPSAHEMHYTAKRAQAEEMRKKTYLPYRQGLFGCLGFSSKSYGAMNGLARSLNPVSSR